MSAESTVGSSHHDGLRIWGDPFQSTAAGSRVLELLREAERRNTPHSLCLTAVRSCLALPSPLDSERSAAPPSDAALRSVGIAWTLTDGVRTFALDGALDAADRARVVAAASAAVPSTAPLVVCTAGGADDLLLASLEYPDACMSIDAMRHEPGAVFDLLARHLATWPQLLEGVPRALLEPLLAAPAGTADVWLHFANADDAGTESLWRALAALPAASRGRVRIHGRARDALPEWPQAEPLDVECVDGPIDASTFDAVRAVVQPFTRELPRLAIARAFAAGRPIIASCFGEGATWVGAAGVAYRIAGRRVGDEFVPSERSLLHSMSLVLTRPADAAAVGSRGRTHLLERFVTPRPVAPPSDVRGSLARPLVVLEAPLFETSSSSELTIATAEALLARDRVDVLLRPRTPFARGHDVATFTRRAPHLIGALCRRPPRADLWLSSGWPTRRDRPDAVALGLRVDWEYGALPTELTPTVTEECDIVVVHSEFVRRTIQNAGVPPDRIRCVPHGVDAAVFHDAVPPHPRVVAFKGDRRSVLFVGGAIWRKGIDLVVKTLLENYTVDDPLCLIVKTLGAESSYHGFHMQELLERMRALPRAVDVLILDELMAPAELASVYTACDVLLHPYRGEGFALPVLEARACGLPVVVTGGVGAATDDHCADGAGVIRIDAKYRFIDLDGPHEGRPFVFEPDPSSVRDALARALCGDHAPCDPVAVRAAHTWDAAAARIEAIAFEAFTRDAAHRSSAARGSRRDCAATSARGDAVRPSGAPRGTS